MQAAGMVQAAHLCFSGTGGDASCRHDASITPVRGWPTHARLDQQARPFRALVAADTARILHQGSTSCTVIVEPTVRRRHTYLHNSHAESCR